MNSRKRLFFREKRQLYSDILPAATFCVNFAIFVCSYNLDCILCLPSLADVTPYKEERTKNNLVWVPEIE